MKRVIPTRLWCLIIALILFGIVGIAQVRADKLRWRWVAGDVYEVKCISKANITVSAGEDKLPYQNEVVVTGQWTVVEFNSSEVARLHWQVSRVQINPNPLEDQVTVDTEVPAKNEDQKTLQATLRGVLQKRFEILVSSTARLTMIKELPHDSAGLKNTPTGRSAANTRVPFPQVFNAEGVARAFAHVFVEFPLADVEPGTTWKRMELLNTPYPKDLTVYRYLGMNPQGPEISLTSRIQLPIDAEKNVKVKSQQVSGKLFFNSPEQFIEKVVVEVSLETSTYDDGEEINVNHQESSVIELKKLLP